MASAHHIYTSGGICSTITGKAGKRSKGDMAGSNENVLCLLGNKIFFSDLHWGPCLYGQSSARSTENNQAGGRIYPRLLVNEATSLTLTADME